MKYKSSLTFLLVSACVISLTLSTNRLLWAGEKNLEKRVSNLEMQVSDLNTRVIQLEKQLSAKSNGAQVVNQNIPAGKAAWRKLQKGMNKDQVRQSWESLKTL